ncbi:M20 family metallopeptidase [Mesorhizobium amorphae]|uniref:M20 family metallopeptidase n=1 Tax=Mesorhizobium amorphae TaxID=71433 RepID=UPI0021B2DA67|nr:M20/M25/M40 family metallo-hydrolase [Mesorhizobium amorphae]
MSDGTNEVWSRIDADRDYVVNLARDLVRIPSVNPKFQVEQGINREADVQLLLDGHLKDLGFETRGWDVFPGRPNLIGEWDGSDDRSLILCGHIDVVPVGDASRWARDPFGGEIAEGKLWGRGAVDMKAGVAACVAAARAVKQAGIKLEGRLAIHSVVDEEAGGFGAMDLVKREKRLARRAIIAERHGATLYQPRAA